MHPLARAFAILLGSSLFVTLLQVAKGKISAVVIGPAGMGQLSQLNYLVSLGIILCVMGLSDGLVRHLSLYLQSNNKQRARETVSTAFISIAVVSILWVSAAVVFRSPIASWLGGEDLPSWLIPVAAIAVPFGALGRVYLATIRSERRPELIARSQITANATAFLFYVPLVFLFGLTGALLGLICLHAITAAFQFSASIKAVGKSITTPSPANFKASVLRENSGYGMSSLLLTTTNVVSLMVVGSFIISGLGAAANGLFVVAQRITSGYIGALAQAAGSQYFPSLARQDENQKLKEEIRVGVRLYTTVLPTITIPLSLLAEPIISTLFSSEFSAASSILCLLVIGDLIRICSESVGLALLARKKLVAYCVPYLIYCALFVTLSFEAVNQESLVLIAIAYNACHLIAFTMNISLAHFYFGHPLNTRTWKAILVAILFQTTASLSSINNPLEVTFALLLGAIIYALWLAFCLCDPESRNHLTFAFRKIRRKLGRK